MQNVNMSNLRVIKTIYFFVAIVFHLILLFTDFGNYFHGGTFTELIVLHVIAVLVIVLAIKLMPIVRTIEKIFIMLCTIVPIISIFWSLMSVFY